MGPRSTTCVSGKTDGSPPSSLVKTSPRIEPVVTVVLCGNEGLQNSKTENVINKIFRIAVLFIKTKNAACPPNSRRQVVSRQVIEELDFVGSRAQPSTPELSLARWLNLASVEVLPDSEELTVKAFKESRSTAAEGKRQKTRTDTSWRTVPSSAATRQPIQTVALAG